MDVVPVGREVLVASVVQGVAEDVAAADVVRAPVRVLLLRAAAIASLTQGIAEGAALMRGLFDFGVRER